MQLHPATSDRLSTLLQPLQPYALVPLQVYSNPLWGFGSLAGLCLVIQQATGVFLAMGYTSHVDLVFLPTHLSHWRDAVSRERRQQEHGARQQPQAPQLRPPQPPRQTGNRQRRAAWHTSSGLMSTCLRGIVRLGRTVCKILCAVITGDAKRLSTESGLWIRAWKAAVEREQRNGALQDLCYMGPAARWRTSCNGQPHRRRRSRKQRQDCDNPHLRCRTA